MKATVHRKPDSEPNLETGGVVRKHVHLVLQAKGGSGKTVAASFLAQYYNQLGAPTLFLDTDPFNSSFHAYKSLEVLDVDVFNEERDAIDQRAFDQLVNLIIEAERGSSVVIDTGSGNFQDLMTYMLQNDFVSLLQNNFGCEVYFHIVIAGGVMFTETLSVLGDILAAFSEPKFIVWLNEYSGALQSVQGVLFEDAKVIKENRDRIDGMVRMSKYHETTFGRDLQELMRQRMTFADGMTGLKFDVMERHRIGRIWEDIRGNLEKALPVPPSPAPELTVVEEGDNG